MGPAGLPVSVALVDAGTNDAGQDRTASQMTTDMGALLDRILAASPTVKVLVAQITISTGFTPAQQQAESSFDDSLPALAQARGPRVAVVDMRGVPLGSDGVHPDDVGAQDMAGRWYAALGSSGWLP
jgi:lysophospholipase L1-like esterase